MEEITDVIIVGAGPTGLMAGSLLARSGIKFIILDKTSTQVHESRAFGVHARSMELLLNLGLEQDFLAKGLMASGAQIFVNGKKRGELNFLDIGREDTPYSFILMVPQWDIEAILVDYLRTKNIEVYHNTEVTHLEQTDEGIVVQAKNKAGEVFQIKSSYLIGADGAHSIVRRNLDLAFEGAAYPQGFLLADCKIDWPLDYDHMKVFLHDRDLVVYLPLKGKKIGRIIAVKQLKTLSNETAESSGAEPATLEEVEEIVRRVTKLAVKLTDPVWVTGYRIHHRAVKTYSVGKVFLAGDAAHIHSPAGGQGMNTGLQDAANLVWKMIVVLKGYAGDNLLATYQTERWPVGQKILKYTDRLFSMISSQKLWIARLRNMLLPRLIHFVSTNKKWRARTFQFISQLGIHYHDNDFLANVLAKTTADNPHKTLLAGCRAPNALITRNNDVFNLIKGYCFHVLALSRTSLTLDDIETVATALDGVPNFIGLEIKVHFITQSLIGRNKRIICAESSQIFNIYCLTPTVPQAIFFIRPDGYIAYRSDGLDVTGLKMFISERFPKNISAS